MRDSDRIDIPGLAALVLAGRQAEDSLLEWVSCTAERLMQEKGLRDSNARNEVVQQTLIDVRKNKAIQGLAKPEKTPEALVRRILNCNLMDYYRQRTRTHALQASQDDETAISPWERPDANEEDSPKVAARNELLVRFRKTLAGEERRVIEYWNRGLESDEIASLLRRDRRTIERLCERIQKRWQMFLERP